MKKHIRKKESVSNLTTEVQPEIQAQPEHFRRMNLCAAGIDVGATSHFVAVPKNCSNEPVREFKSFTQDLITMADWLKECGVKSIAMESTGVYWIPLFEHPTALARRHIWKEPLLPPPVLFECH